MELLTKEGYAACVGCGYCCKKVSCLVGQLFGTDAKLPCSHLLFKDGRHYCGLVLNNTDELRNKITKALHIGAGCCSPLNSDRIPFIKEAINAQAPIHPTTGRDNCCPVKPS